MSGCVARRQKRIHAAEMGIRNIDAEFIPETDADDISAEEKQRREEVRYYLVPRCIIVCSTALYCIWIFAVC